MPYDIDVPMRAAAAIYAKENGKGMVFKDDDEEDGDAPPPEDTTSGSKRSGGKNRPKLTIVK